MVAPDKPIVLGQIGTAYGVRGWVHIQSHTAPSEQIFSYQPWWLKTPNGWQMLTLIEGKPHGKGLVALLEGVEDRDQARDLARLEIVVDAAQLPSLDEGEYYWHQLEGLQVICEYEGQRQILGRVKRLMETGANDVLVVRGDRDSIDRRERLIPYLPGQAIKQIDLAAGEMVVDWDPDF